MSSKPRTPPVPSVPTPRANAFGDLVITSGQIPVDPATGEIPEGISAQAEQSCKNVGRHPGGCRHRL